jgi:hypothetical protein
MVPAILACVVVAGAAGVIGVGVVRMLLPKKMTIVDYPELPAPAAEDLARPAKG